MKLLENEAKAVFDHAGISVPSGTVAADVDDVLEAIETIGTPAMLKAQVLHGGRGQAGLVTQVRDAEGAAAQARRIFRASDEQVFGILVEQALSVQAERYLSVTIDDVSGRPLAVATSAGGVEVEDLTTQNSDLIRQLQIDPLVGVRKFEALTFLKSVGWQGEQLLAATEILLRLYDVFENTDAELVEVNPLIITTDGLLVAADAKISIDDAALYRQPEFAGKVRRDMQGKVECYAQEKGLTYVDLEGNIAVLSGGAGFTMALLDLISTYGGKPANFLDMTGGGSPDVFQNMVDVIVTKAKREPEVRAVVLSYIITATSFKNAVEGLVTALQRNHCPIPIFGTIQASGASVAEMPLEEGLARLRGAGIRMFDDIEDAVEAAVHAANLEE